MSESTARKGRQKPTDNGVAPTMRPAGHTLTPFKAIIQIVGAHRDEKGEVIQEVALDAFPLYRPQFDTLAQTVEASWPQVEAQYFAPQNGSSGELGRDPH